MNLRSSRKRTRTTQNISRRTAADVFYSTQKYAETVKFKNISAWKLEDIWPRCRTSVHVENL